MLDLDLNGGMGTGDFSFFAGCFGGCYGPTDPCAVANFDGDPNRCAGTGDFAGFAGCFGMTCSQCANCHPAASAANSASALTDLSDRVSIRLVAVIEPSLFDESEALPDSIHTVRVGQLFQVEVWANSTGGDIAGLYVDVRYPLGQIVPSEIEHGALYTTLSSGVIDVSTGQVRTLGGCVALGEDIMTPELPWKRVATMQAVARSRGEARLTLAQAAAPYGVSLMGTFGDLQPSSLELEGIRLVVEGTRMLDDKGVKRVESRR